MLTFGLFFYWFSWIMWISIMFFMHKSTQRTILSFAILVLITFVNKNIIIGHFELSISYVILFIGCLIMYTKLNRQLYHTFITFTVMISYSAILLWKNSTPLWLFIHELLLIPLFCGFVIIILSKGMFNRITTGLLGITAGELLYHLILSSYDLNLIIGDLSFFDHLFITLIFILIIHMSQQAVHHLYSLLSTYKREFNVRKVNNYKKLS